MLSNEPKIDKATRIIQWSKTLIDLIYTSKIENIGECGVVHLTISDHSLVYAVRRARAIKSQPRTITFRSYAKFNVNKFVEDLLAVLFHIIEAIDDVDLAWSTWKSMFVEVCNNHAPVVSRKVKGETCPWMTNLIKQL